MANDFIPKQDDVLDEWEENFLAKLAIYGATLGIDPALEAECTATVGSHRTSLNLALQKKNEAKAAVADKDAQRTAAVAIIRDIARKCKTSSAFTKAIGEELGINPTEQTLNIATAKPEVSRITQLVDQIVFDWVKGGMEGIVVYGAKRTAETVINLITDTQPGDNPSGINPAHINPPNLIWEEIGRDFRSPYEDKRRNLSEKPEIRFYKLHYLYKDQLVGQDSDIIKVIAEIY